MEEGLVTIEYQMSFDLYGFVRCPTGWLDIRRHRPIPFLTAQAIERGSSNLFSRRLTYKLTTRVTNSVAVWYDRAVLLYRET